jgi:O-antigen/teichoic acid export membrane protein
MVIMYIFIMISGQIYGPHSIGVIALSMALITIGSVIGRLGMDTYILKQTAIHYVRNGQNYLITTYVALLKVVIPVSLGISIIIFFSSNFLAEEVFHDSSLIHPFEISAIFLTFFSLFFINTEIFRGMKKITIFSLLKNTVTPIISLILLLLLIFFYQGHNLNPFYAQVSAIFLVSLISIIFLLKFFNFKLDFLEKPKRRISIQSMLSSSTPMMLSASIYISMTWVDTIMIGVYMDTESVGTYNTVLKVSLIANMVMAAVNSVSATEFSEMWSQNRIKELNLYIKKNTKLIFFASTPILIILAIFSKHILSLFGDSFELGYVALLILIVGQFVHMATGSTDYILNMIGYEKYVRNITFLAAVVNVILNYILIPKFGMEGAAFSTAVSVVVWKVLGVIVLKRKVGIDVL